MLNRCSICNANRNGKYWKSEFILIIHNIPTKQFIVCPKCHTMPLKNIIHTITNKKIKKKNKKNQKNKIKILEVIFKTQREAKKFKKYMIQRNIIIRIHKRKNHYKIFGYKISK